MAFHRGNAWLSNVVADNLRTTWHTWAPSVIDQFGTLVPEPKMHTKYFNTRHFAVVSLHVRVIFDMTAPDGHSVCSIKLPETLRIKPESYFKNQCVVERHTPTAERKFSQGFLIADGTQRGGADAETYITLDRILVQNFGHFVGGQNYTIRGQLTFEPGL